MKCTRAPKKILLITMVAVSLVFLAAKLRPGYFSDIQGFGARHMRIADYFVGKRLPFCPEKPPSLLGFRNLTEVERAIPELEEELGSILQPGGHYSPPDCQPRNKTAILIPFRNRWPHLRVLLNYLPKVLIRQQLDFTLFLIEQDQNSTFNRGLLLNVGVLEALKRDRYTCFVMHDVDLLTMDDRNLYRCQSRPRHLCTAINKNHFRLPYPTSSGGVYALSLDHVTRVNGHSNLFFGWGGEDDDIRFRLNSVGLHFTRNPPDRAKFIMIKHQRDKGNEVTTQSEALKTKERAVRRMRSEGLNTTRYRLNRVVVKPLFTWVKVTINQTDVLRTAPQDVQDMFKHGLTFRKH